MRRKRRLGLWILAILILLVLTALLVAAYAIAGMPGSSHDGPLQPLTADETALSDRLRRHVRKLAGDIGERNVLNPQALEAAAKYIESSLADAGYAPVRHAYRTAGQTCSNIEVEIAGGELREEIVVIGAHYDSVSDCPGANDNASGVASLLALARAFAGKRGSRTLRFVAFTNEEPPHFWTDEMGSLVYAKRCRANNDNVVAMLSLETIGYYSDEKDSQHYPLPLRLLYPSTGNFIGFVGNRSSGDLVRRVVGSFRNYAQFPSRGAVLPNAIREAGWSDHWSFWQLGYPALMVTDTAPFRYAHYHRDSDAPDKLDYDHMARVTAGLKRVIGELVGAAAP